MRRHCVPINQIGRGSKGKKEKKLSAEHTEELRAAGDMPGAPAYPHTGFMTVMIRHLLNRPVSSLSNIVIHEFIPITF